jgi:DNA-binding PadR family transcriptional regulator
VAADGLSTTAYAVLGLLTFGRELSGYDLKKWADASLRFFWWSPASSHIYRELARLEARGYLTSRAGEPGDARRKRVYAITDAGRAAVAEWIAHTEPEPIMLKHPAALRTWLGHAADTAQLRAVLEEHRVEVRRLLREIDHGIAATEGDAAMRYPGIVLEWVRAIYAADATATETALERLGE